MWKKRLWAIIGSASTLAGPVFAANQWTAGLTIATVQGVGGGGFVVYLSGWTDSACSQNPTGIYFYSGNNSVTSDGVKSMLAMALTAFTSGKTISVLYDNSGATGPAGLCWGTNIELNQ